MMIMRVGPAWRSKHRVWYKGSDEMNNERKNVEYPQDHDFEKCNEIECDCDCKYCQNMHWE